MMQAAPATPDPMARAMSRPFGLRQVLASAVGAAVAWGYGSFLGALVHVSWVGLVSAVVAGAWILVALVSADHARARRSSAPA